MSSYENVPDDALRTMLANSRSQKKTWKNNLTEAQRRVNGAMDMVSVWTRSEAEQEEEASRRGILPEHDPRPWLETLTGKRRPYHLRDGIYPALVFDPREGYETEEGMYK